MPAETHIAGDANNPERNVSAYPSRGILQEPVWTWEVPAYFFLGGMAGASALIALGAEVTGNRVLATRSKLVALAAIGLSPPLLISDLGRPERFYNMLRVFRPTSPMNVGTWILSAFGSATASAAFLDVAGRFKPLGRLSTLAAGLLGPPLATYTGVLVAQTSVPVWHEARRHLPVVFAASALASGAATAAASTPTESSREARLLAAAAALGEVAAAEWMNRSLGEVADVYRSGAGGSYSRLARFSALGGAAGMAVLGRHRLGAVLSASAIAIGALSERFAVWKAGIESARRT